MPLKVFPWISVKGTPYECGLQHGTQTQTLVLKQTKFYFDLWKRLWGVERAKVLEQCRKLVPVIGEYNTDMLEELEGIAKGADLPLEEIVALNSRAELGYAFNPVSAPESAACCTSLAALPEVTKDGHTLIGQNREYWSGIYDQLIVLEIQQKGKPNIVTTTEAGVIGSPGMNSAGIGLCGNGLLSNLDSFTQRPPFWLLLRAILNADTFSNAIRAVVSTKLGISGNFVIAHRDGEAIDLEVTPKDVGFLYPEDGIISHSNHFLFFSNREDIVDMFKAIAPDSLFRCERAQRLLAKDRGHIDVNSFQRVFRDHFSYPHSLCRHLDPQDTTARQSTTIESVIMDLEEQAIFLAEGPPCQHEYIKLSPESLKGN